MEDAVALGARAVAAWHESWLSALGLESSSDDQVWRADDAPPIIYFGAITLRPDTPAEAVMTAPGSVCDSWQTLDLAPYAYRVFGEEPWFLRPAGPLADDAKPAELEIVRVRTAAEVEEFELVSVRGFEHEDATIPPGTFHPPSVLQDPAMAMFIGRVEGRPVGAATAYRTAGAVGVFGVATIASARRRGYGSALTRAAMLPESGLPSVLAPSEEGKGVYLRLGFEPVGALTIWTKEDQDQ
jgi:hypothetical protein